MLQYCRGQALGDVTTNTKQHKCFGKAWIPSVNYGNLDIKYGFKILLARKSK
jgi:hypothetical protein